MKEPVFIQKKNGFALSKIKHNTELIKITGSTQTPENFCLSWSDKQKIYPSACNFQNYKLNRYNDVLAWEKSRVVLNINNNNNNNTGYINANWVVDPISDKKFIATQAPLDITQDHFLQMVWETRCSCIVTLGKVVEDNKNKMHQYWPREIGLKTVTKCNNYSLKLIRVESKKYLVRSFLFTHGRETREIVQLHMENWPDHCAIESDPILAMLNDLDYFVQNSRKFGLSEVPIVHCSAGLGRTGSLIAIYFGIKRIDKYISDMIASKYLAILTSELVKNVNIDGIIDIVRSQRHNAIQTKKQYTMIFRSLNYYLEKKCHL